jgi:DNA-binding GntR family transcriptional regulator
MSQSYEFPALHIGSGDEEPQLSSLSRLAYQRLRDRIITLQLTPGALVNEAALMQELELGRTPIREALQRLACEGLVVLRPRRGAFIAGLSILDLQQIFELRRVVEGYAATLAAERASESDIGTMRAILERLDAAGQNGNAQAYIEIDRAFHRALARSTRNRFLESTLERLYNLNLRLWYLALDQIGSMRAAVEEHRRILNAIEQRDGQQAQAIIQEHITSFQNRIREIL